jgi:outer membrane protein insertion porin family
MPTTIRRTALAGVIALMAAVSLSSQEGEAWYMGKTISNVEFEGARSSQRRDLEGVVKPFIGRKFSDELFLELQSVVSDLDYFESADPSALPVEADDSSVIIRFTVVPRPIIDAIKFEGNSGLKGLELSNVVITKVGDLSNKLRQADDEEALRKHYIEKGYTEISVSSEERASGKNGDSSTLFFIIDEGRPIAVKKISFSGNAAFSEKSLKGALSLKEPAFLVPGAYQEDLLEKSKLELLGYYRDRGYIDAKLTDVAIDFEDDPKKNRSLATVLFLISEGPQWQYGQVRFEGNVIFTTDKLASLVLQKKGPFSASKFGADISRVRNLYFENGYVFSQISPKEERDEASLTLSYLVQIVERDRAHISDIVIKGNIKTKDKVILREIPVLAGDIFSKKKIEEGLKNLINLQYFSDIVPDVQPISEQLIDLIINVTEQSTAGFNFSIAYQPDYDNMAVIPIGGTVSWNDSNFLGDGHKIDVTAELSPLKQSLIFGFTEKWLFETRWLGGFNLSFSHEEKKVAQDILSPLFANGIPDPYDSYEEYSAANFLVPDENQMTYDSLSFALGPSLGYLFKTPLGDFGVRVDEHSKLENIFYDETKYRPYTQDLRDNHDQWLLTDTLSLYTYYDALDYAYIPTKGVGVTNKISMTGFFGFEPQQYFRDDVKVEAFLPLFDIPVTEKWNFKLILGAHSSLTALFAKPWAPLAVRTGYYPKVDGMMSFRGWTDLYGYDATQIWYNWLELRMPLSEQLLWLDFFIDGGVVQGAEGLLHPIEGGAVVQEDRTSILQAGMEDWAFSAGLGLRIAIPQLPIKLGIAKKFVIRDGQLTGIGGNVFSSDEPGTGFNIFISVVQSVF